MVGGASVSSSGIAESLSLPLFAPQPLKKAPIRVRPLRGFPPSSSRNHDRELLRQLSPGIPFDTSTTRLAEELGTSLEHGLEESDVRDRAKAYGLNLLDHQQRDTIGSLLWKQVSNAMTVVLLIALIVSFSVKDYPDGAVIVGISPPISR
jgi:magnesium-transporting ATPase (P-type)